jgi:DNA-binding NarL/FixJ family response regulator
MTHNAVLIEDSPTIRETLIPAMEELADIKVIAFAETANDAKDVLVRHAAQWHVAVVDLFLKQGSGFDVLSACRRRRAKQKIIVLTNYATADIRRRCAELGADAVFDKSTELDSFFELCMGLDQH